MRYGPEHKAESKARILQAAARSIGANGPDRVAVADVMAGAGLTHGAFYAHFGSKEALVAEALSQMFADARQTNSALDAALGDESATDVGAGLRAFLEGYLSREHRDSPEFGCPLPALAGDMARGDSQARANFVSGLARMNARIEAALALLGLSDAAAAARAVVAQIVGAVALARAVGKGAQSDAILNDNLQSIKGRLGL